MARPALALVALAAVALVGCGSGSGTQTTTASPPASKPAAGKTVWLCFPGRSADPCGGSLATTVVRADGGTSVEHPRPASHPLIDCFYVYPTVSSEQRGNSDLRIQLPEVVVAQAQAARFSQVCRVFAPMYRQITDSGLTDPKLHASPLEAYDSVLDAWRDYLAHDNHGRGVVLIGHSQGAYVLKHLVATEIERSPAQRRLLVSTILLGGQVLAPNSRHDQGTFTDVPPCSSPSDTGCAIAYSSFGRTPPPRARFGRDASATTHVMCVNPASPGSTSTQPVAPLFPTILIRLLGGTLPASVNTAWVALPDLYTARCERQGTASWLQITRTNLPGDTRPAVKPEFGPGWGLHATDVNIALGDLVRVVGLQAHAYVRAR
jgi:pimeloyl-ACP methyl ester carboxylesterase